MYIYFINKDAFLNVIHENIDIFIKELGENFEPEVFLANIISCKQSLLEIIHYHEGILGILLGYGRHNAMLFQKKADILGRCWAYDEYIEKPHQIGLDLLSKSIVLKKIDDQLGSFSEIHEYSPLVLVSPLGFAADNRHPETKQLRKKYHSTREKINQLYGQNNPFDLILRRLIGSESQR